MSNSNMIKVTAAIIEKEGKVLLAKRNKNDPLRDKWEFAGGKIENGETPEECLKRELHEELGIDAEIGGFLCSSKYSYDHISINLLAYRVKGYTGELNPTDHDAIEWVSPSDFYKYDFPEADKPIIEYLVKDYSI